MFGVLQRCGVPLTHGGNPSIGYGQVDGPLGSLSGPHSLQNLHNSYAVFIVFD